MSARPNRRVLFVTYDFPPSLMIGAHACYQLARYFPEYGWDPVVLTLRESGGPRDRDGAWPFPGPVIEARNLPHPISIYRRLKPPLDWSEAGESTARPGTLRRWALSLLNIPDEHTGWLLPAVLEGVRTVHRHRIEHIVSSAPYWTNHLVGLAVAYLTGRPWTAHFRDPWMQDPPQKPTSALSQRLDTTLERLVMTRATSVVCVTEAHSEALRQAYPELPPRKFVTVPNGYDEAEWTGVSVLPNKRRGPDEHFVITYAGRFYKERNPLPLFRALRALIDAGKIPADQVQVELIGWCDVAEGKLVSEMAEECGLSKAVTLVGALSRAETIGRVSRANLLLVVAQGLSLHVPGKTYEYLRAGRPILALAPPGALADFLGRTRAAWVVAAEDRESIERAVAMAYQRWDQGLDSPRSAPELVASFDRRVLAGRFTAVLDTASAAAPVGAPAPTLVTGPARPAHHCPRCRVVLRRGPAEVACAVCGRSWPIENGVVRYESLTGVGTVPGSELRALNRDAAEVGWRRAVARRFPGQLGDVSDLNRASWISLLPVADDAVVLNVGVGLGGVTSALARSYRHVVALEPERERADFLATRFRQEGVRNVEVVQSGLAALPFPPAAFDVIVLNGIVDHPDAWVGAPSRRTDLLRGLARHLKAGGVIVVGAENSLRYNLLGGAGAPRRVERVPGTARRRTKQGYARLFRSAGLRATDWWWPEDGYNTPHTLYRLSRTAEIREHLIRGQRLTDRIHGPAWSRRAKTFVLGRLGSMPLLSPDFVVFVQHAVVSPPAASGAPRSIPAVVEHAMREAGVLGDGEHPEVVSLIANRGRNRQILHVARAGGDVSAVVKVARLGLSRDDCIEYEQSWLRLLARLRRADPAGCLRAPRPLGFARVGTFAVAVEEAVTGRAADSVLLEPDIFRKRATVVDMLDRVADWCIYFVRHFREDLRWREAFADVELRAAWDRPTAWASPASIPQHGDLNPEHVFIDADGRLTTIDWEDAGLGYPPMFDFFCFVTGMVFSPEPRRYDSDAELLSRSFLATYCERNWFSEAMARAAERVAGAFGLAYDQIPAAFDAYLIAREQQFTEPRFGKAASGAELHRRVRAEFESRRNASILAAGPR